MIRRIPGSLLTDSSSVIELFMSTHLHEPVLPDLPPAAAIEGAVRLFRALGDPGRLRLLLLLAEQERCVGELADAFEEGMSTVSQRLRMLRADRLVVSRRDGKHVYYALADVHIAELIASAIDHAGESI